MLIELLRSWQLSRKKREEKLNGGGGGFYWPFPAQLPVHRSQWKFIFPIGHISFRMGLDSMLKLIRNYINPIGFAVWGHHEVHMNFPSLHQCCQLLPRFAGKCGNGYFYKSFVVKKYVTKNFVIKKILTCFFTKQNYSQSYIFLYTAADLALFLELS